MAWQPNLSRFPHKPGNSKLLWEAFQKFQPAHLQDKLSDEKGVFALNTDRGVLCAKKYVYGNIVSSHKRAVVSAANQNKKLVMYIKTANKFYQFNPFEIIRDGMENIRGNAKMLNWNIKYGERVKTIA